MPRISIIVPVYNAEKYIKHCIDSILGQTYKDFELLIIDDGSSDSSGAICDEYAKEDSRVRVYHKENGGVSSARNYGLNKSTGSYITFSDSDDILVNTAFQTYIDAFDVDENIDIVKTGYCQEFDNGNPSKIFSFRRDVILEEKSEYLDFLVFDKSNYNGFLWNECLRKEILIKHRFDESINWCEDHIFSFACLYEARKIYISKSVTYRYQIRENVSLSNTTDAFLKIKAIGCLYQTRKKLITSYNNGLEDKLNKAYQGGVLYFVSNNKANYKYKERKLLREAIPNKDILLRRYIFLLYFSLPLWAGEMVLAAYHLMAKFKNSLSC